MSVCVTARRSFPVALVMALVACAIGTASSAPSDPAGLAKAGCRDALSKVQSGRGKVTVHSTVVKSGGGVLETESVVDVVFSGPKSRFSEVQRCIRNDGPSGPKDVVLTAPGTSVSVDVSYDGSVLTMFDKEKRSCVMVGFDPTAKTQGWPQLTFRRLTKDAGLRGHGLSDLCADLGTAGDDLTTETVGGDECLLLTKEIALHDKDGKALGSSVEYRYWVDPAKGYTVLRQRVYFKESGDAVPALAQEYTNEVKDYGGGVWAPRKSTVDRYHAGPSGKIVKDTVTTTFADDFAINITVPAEDLTVKPPSGTSVCDQATGANHMVP